MRRCIVLALLALTGLAAPAAAQEPTLGIDDLYGRYGSGWGEVQPRVVSNGGVPSGSMSAIAWTGWGQPEAFGRGRSWQYKPRGGYYRRQVRVQLRATRLLECAAAPGQPAYTRLIVRKQTRPGGPWEDWYPWGLDLCDGEAQPGRCAPVSFAGAADRGARRITAWDTDCATAQRIAADSRRVRYRGEFFGYRFTFEGFVCRGYSFSGPRRRIFFSCSRDSAIADFVRN